MEKNLIFYFPCGKEPLLFKFERKIPPKWEKPLKTVSMLKRRLWLTEASLFSLNKNDYLVIPPDTDGEEVLSNLRKMRRKRLFWFIGLLLIFPFTWILTPIPGPNMPYFYVLGRLILHFFSIKSISKLLKEERFIFRDIKELPSSSELVKVLQDCILKNKRDSFDFS